MSFGDIYAEWEERTARPYGKKRMKRDARRRAAAGAVSEDAVIDGSRPQKPIDAMVLGLRRYGVVDKDAIAEREQHEESRAVTRKKLLAMPPEDSIDLHGLTREQAWAQLDEFIPNAYRRGLKKVLVVHGKGNHSPGEPVLRRVVQLYFEQSEFTGESSFSVKKDTSSGASWVILRRKKEKDT